jgi:nitrate/TMAO reductase-like tetraheme cytochrome c subunit
MHIKPKLAIKIPRVTLKTPKIATNILIITGVVVLGLVVVSGLGLIGVKEASKNPGYCSNCHVMAPYVTSMTMPNRLGYVHAQAAVTCQDCHPQTLTTLITEIAENVTHNYPQELASINFQTKACLNCHGTYEQLAQRTQRLVRNPHDSHEGMLECRTCHRVHSDSVYFCGTCHGPATMPKVGWILPTPTP